MEKNIISLLEAFTIGCIKWSLSKKNNCGCKSKAYNRVMNPCRMLGSSVQLDLRPALKKIPVVKKFVMLLQIGCEV